jgi:hypothetical protein
MPLLPHRFLLHVSHPCRHVTAVPREDEDRILDLPEDCRVDNFAGLDGKANFADVRIAWNELGLALQVEVRGKEQLPQGDAARPRASDGVTFWIDTRDSRSSHRASRFCHQVHLLPTGGGPDHDEPAVVQGKINRALHDAPTWQAGSVPFRCALRKKGYLVEAFLPAAALNGFDPEQNPRLGFFYSVKDGELGEQLLSLDAEFPYWEDPSLWGVLELVR